MNSQNNLEEKAYKERQKEIIEQRKDWFHLYQAIANLIKCVNRDVDDLVRLLEQLRTKILEEVREDDKKT